MPASRSALAWAALWLATDLIAAGFNLKAEGIEVLRAFTHLGAGGFLFTAALFVSNAAFNNLGRPTLSTAFNWTRDAAAIPLIAFALGARPVLLMLPAPIDLDPAGAPDWISDYRHVMGLVAHQTGSTLVDGPAVFAEEGATVADFFDQVHPAGTGHRMLGEALAEALVDSAP